MSLASITPVPTTPTTDSDSGSTSPSFTFTDHHSTESDSHVSVSTTVTPGSAERDAVFQAALDEIIRNADVQMKALDSIHEAMQREIGDMFDRHESAKVAAKKIGKIMK